MNKNKKNLNKTIVTFLGLAAIGAGGGVAAIASAASTTPTNTAQVNQNVAGKSLGVGRRGPPGVIGIVTSVSGTSIVVTDKSGAVYTVDLANAKITKNINASEPTTITATDINIGDTIGVRGTISGSRVAATFAMDGISPTPSRGGMSGGFDRHEGKDHWVSGKVTAVSGTTVTITRSDGKAYTVDASKAKLSKMEFITTADLVVGDFVGVDGTVSGTSVTATHIMDGMKTHEQFAGEKP